MEYCTTFITDTAHYTTVLNLAAQAKRSLWIGTADIKELYVLQGRTEKPFLGVLSDLLGRGVEVRRGSECGKCQRRGVCPDPIIG